MNPRFVVQRQSRRVDILDTQTQEFAISYATPHWRQHLDDAEKHANRTCALLNDKEAIQLGLPVSNRPDASLGDDLVGADGVEG